MTTKEFFKEMHKIELKESEMCKEIHKQIKELCGEDKMIVFNAERKIKVNFGDYGSFDAVAVCQGVLMARCECGWCDKPIQPYYANKWEICKMLQRIENGEYRIEVNPIKEHKLSVCC